MPPRRRLPLLPRSRTEQERGEGTGQGQEGIRSFGGCIPERVETSTTGARKRHGSAAIGLSVFTETDDNTTYNGDSTTQE
eukprot:1156221-Heterocapsa_arctica.AAC.1